MKNISVYKYDNGFKQGLFIGKERYIIVDNDCCHHIGNIENSSALSPLLVIQKLPKQEIPFNEFCDYWGIKSRIRNNYKLLLESMKEIGLNTSDMSKWGELE